MDFLIVVCKVRYERVAVAFLDNGDLLSGGRIIRRRLHDRQRIVTVDEHAVAQGAARFAIEIRTVVCDRFTVCVGDIHADVIGELPIVDGVGVKPVGKAVERSREVRDSLLGAALEVERSKSERVGKRLVCVIRAESSPVVVGLEVNVFVAVLGQIVVCVDGRYAAVHRRVRRLDVVRLRIGVDLRFEPFGQSHFGVVRNYHTVDVKAGELACKAVDRFAVGPAGFLASAKQLKARFVPDVNNAGINACGVVVGRLCRDKGRLIKLVVAHGGIARINGRIHGRFLLCFYVGRNAAGGLFAAAALEHKHNKRDKQREYKQEACNYNNAVARSRAVPAVRSAFVIWRSASVI